MPILFVATVFFLMSFWMHFPGMSGNVYSDLMDTLWQRILNAPGIVPYVSYKLEYPAVSAIVLYLASIPRKMLAFYFSMSAILFASMSGAIYVVYKLLRERGEKVQAISYFIVLTPCFVYFSIYSFDWIAAAFMVGSIYFAYHKRPVESGLLVGLATAARVIPIIILPFLLLEMKRRKNRTALLGSAAASWLAVNAYFILFDFQGFLYPYQFQAGYSVEDSWLGLAGPYAREASVLLFGAFLVVLLLERKRFNLFQQSLLVTLAFVLTSFKFPPQYMILLLPLFALTAVSYVEFMIANILDVVILLWYFTPAFSLGDPLLVTSPVQWVAYLRQFVLLVVFLKLFLRGGVRVVSKGEGDVPLEQRIPIPAPAFAASELDPPSDSNGLKLPRGASER